MENRSISSGDLNSSGVADQDVTGDDTVVDR